MTIEIKRDIYIVMVSQREREGRESFFFFFLKEFLKVFFQNFLTFFSLFLYFSTLFPHDFSQKFGGGGVYTLMLASHFCHLTSPFFFCLILISSPIFVLLFGGLSELHFLQILYAQKVLDVQFPTILGSFDLELWSSRYCARKEGDVVLKNFVTFFLEIFISSNPEQISSSPFDENYL